MKTLLFALAVMAAMLWFSAIPNAEANPCERNPAICQ